MQRFCLSCSEAGATKTEGISAQYAENSVSEVVDKMKAGAVRDERSPLKEAIDLRKEPQEPLLALGTAEPSAMM